MHDLRCGDLRLDVGHVRLCELSRREVFGVWCDLMHLLLGRVLPDDCWAKQLCWVHGGQLLFNIGPHGGDGFLRGGLVLSACSVCLFILLDGDLLGRGIIARL